MRQIVNEAHAHLNRLCAEWVKQQQLPPSCFVIATGVSAKQVDASWVVEQFVQLRPASTPWVSSGPAATFKVHLDVG